MGNTTDHKGIKQNFGFLKERKHTDSIFFSILYVTDNTDLLFIDDIWLPKKSFAVKTIIESVRAEFQNI